MASKTKEARLNQMNYLEGKLEQRLSVLAEKGLESKKITGDMAVKKLRAEIRETTARLKAIEAREKKLEEMAATKAEKLAAPKQEKANKKKATEEAPEISKRQQKKKKKKEGKEQTA